MKSVIIEYQQNKSFVNIAVADSFMSRFRGLMMRSQLSPLGGLLLENCSSIHCFFMRFTIDAVYLDKDFKVVGRETVRPWRTGRFFKGAKHVLELAEGASEGLVCGMKLVVKDGGKDE